MKIRTIVGGAALLVAFGVTGAGFGRHTVAADGAPAAIASAEETASPREYPRPEGPILMDILAAPTPDAWLPRLDLGASSEDPLPADAPPSPPGEGREMSVAPAETPSPGGGTPALAGILLRALQTVAALVSGDGSSLLMQWAMQESIRVPRMPDGLPRVLVFAGQPALLY